MDGRTHGCLTRALLAAALSVAVLAGVANAKPWAKWAPSPLASDSAYAALSLRPADSLSTRELSWLAVQRDWRAQRDAESQSAGAITESWYPHHVRVTDERFAALASRSYAALADSECAWLVAENAAQHRGHRPPSGHQPAAVLGIVVVSVLAGALGAYLMLGYMFGHTRWL